MAVMVPWYIEIMFRTRQASAMLLHVAGGAHHSITVQVKICCMNMNCSNAVILRLFLRISFINQLALWHHLSLDKCCTDVRAVMFVHTCTHFTNNELLLPVIVSYKILMQLSK